MKLSRLAPFVALAALVGCSPSPSTAAEVAGAQIPVSMVDAAVTGCASLGYELPEAAALRWLVVREAMVSIGEAEGIVLDDDTIRQAAEQDVNNGPLTADEGCATLADGAAAYSLLALQMDPGNIRTALAEVDVNVNPRFGNWDPAEVVIGGSSSLSVPAGQATN